jgi:hypothetical protein
LLVLTPQPDQFIAFGRCDNFDLLLPAPVPSIGHADPVADRLRGRFELSREIIRIAAGADLVQPFVDEIQASTAGGF